jgi:hypothetical protein
MYALIVPVILLFSQMAIAGDTLAPYMRSLVDVYVDEITAKTLQGTCINANGSDSEEDYVKVIREQNKTFCKTYAAGLVDAALALNLKCVPAPTTSRVLQAIRAEAERGSAALETDLARFILLRSLKCTPLDTSQR